MVKKFLSSGKLSSTIRLIETWIESHMAYNDLCGLSAGIVYDRDLIWARGFGFSDPETKTAASSKTLYRIASISKLFTATAVMQLRDAGKLNLDDPVVKYLSWFKIKNRQPGCPPVTIRHLLTHTSGLPREAAFPYWVDFQFPSREKIMETLHKQETAFATETIWKYSNLALSLAGEIVQAVSQKPYADYIRKQILDPLKMKDTHVILSEQAKKKLAKGYGRRMPDGSRLVMPFTDSKGITPAANLTSNVKDLAKFISLQFRDGKPGGKQILKGSTLKEMHRLQWIQPDWTWGWGLGFGVKRMEDKIIVGHGGSLAGYRTRISLCPDEKIGVIVCINSSDGDPLFFADQILRWVSPVIKDTSPSGAKGKKKTDPSREKFVGKYRNFWWDAEIMLYDGDLVLIAPLEDDPMKSMIKLVPEGKKCFRMQGNDGSSSIGEKLIFEFDAHKKIKRLKVGESYIFPIDSWYDPMPGLDLLPPVE